MLNAEIFMGCCCKCFISCILSNQAVTSIGCVLLRRKTDVIVVRGSVTVSERDCLRFVSGSGL